MNDLIAELVLPYLEPKHLLNCRSVNLSWNGLSTRLLNRAGARVQLRLKHAEAKEYLQLIADTAKTAATENRNCIAGMKLHLKIDHRFPAALDTFIELSKLGPSPNPGRQVSSISSLSFSIGESITDKYILDLIGLNRTTLRAIHLEFDESCAENESLSPSSLEFILPALKNLSIEICTRDYSKACNIKLIRRIMEAAPVLEYISFLSINKPCAFAPIFDDLEPQLSRLTHLELYISNLHGLETLSRFQFAQLRRLQILGGGSGLLQPLLRFVAANCPGLKVFEQICTSFARLDGDEAIATVVDTTRKMGISPLTLPKLTHFGCFLGRYLQMNNAMVLHGQKLLNALQTSENLKRVSLNLSSCTALTKLYNEPNDRLRRSKWPGVVSLDLALLTSTMESYVEHLITKPLWDVSAVLQSMFPNLEKIVIRLGNRYGQNSTMNADEELGHLIRLVLGFTSVKELEIVNYHSEWTWGQPGPEPELKTPELESSPLWSLRRNVVLESLTLRDIRATGVDLCQPSRMSPKLNLARFLELMSSNSHAHANSTSMAIRIDSGFLLNSGDGKSYQEWEEELSKIETHKITIF